MSWDHLTAEQHVDRGKALRARRNYHRALNGHSTRVLGPHYTHGTHSTYTTGCRCDPCTDAESDYSLLARKRRSAS